MAHTALIDKSIAARLLRARLFWTQAPMSFLIYVNTQLLPTCHLNWRDRLSWSSVCD